ncbi:MAG: ribonuclease III [Proteobacteria bacterium]|nr:MAG: ribonuclease III [Pseudomonadota bacterium]
MSDIERLRRAIGFPVRGGGLLNQALTHRSAGAVNYERLEYLGDSVLEFVVSEYLYLRFPHAAEGQLTRTRAQIVKEPTLARVARSLSLGDYLRLGGGELKSGGFDRDSILADALEAIIGAFYLDGGLETAREFVLERFADELEGVDPERVHKDPKTMLQEQLQGRGGALPVYEVAGVSGAAHDQVFVVHCRIPGDDRVFEGEGGSKRKAEQSAAVKALSALSTAERHVRERSA